ncbi:MAG: radical SAM protein [Chloroflexi bacterium]|nr:radical SAM protein [Chloroflexota bacterium]
MLSITRLLCGSQTPGDEIRYGESASGHRSRPVHRRPVVVWNITRRCNLHCAHCYSTSQDHDYPGELATDEARRVIDDLAGFGIPALLFSGGEPTTRHDLPELVTYSIGAGLKPVVSTNGTLLVSDRVAELAKAGLDRVGISLDGLRAVNDKFRGSPGAFERTLTGIRNCVAAGMRVSLRVTLTKYSLADLPGLFDLAEAEGVARLCVYHLAYAGRGRQLLRFDLDADERRRVLDFVFRRTLQSQVTGKNLEVLTVDNHADGPYLLLWSQKHAPDRVAEIERLLRRNGGNSAGKGIACIDNVGEVHPDQFWWNRKLGNVRARPFSQIWADDQIQFLSQLRNRQSLLAQQCRDCRWLAMCNGNLRVRAESATGNPWGLDPACYLTPEEIRKEAA